MELTLHLEDPPAARSSFPPWGRCRTASGPAQDARPSGGARIAPAVHGTDPAHFGGMSQFTAARKYQSVQIESSSPPQLLLALYDGCIRFCKAAQIQIESGDVAGKGVSISKAVAILGELRSTLDHDTAPELCDSLERLYVFFQEQLSLANIKMDREIIDPVVTLLTDLRGAWGEAVAKVETEGAAA